MAPQEQNPKVPNLHIVSKDWIARLPKVFSHDLSSDEGFD